MFDELHKEIDIVIANMVKETERRDKLLEEWKAYYQQIEATRHVHLLERNMSAYSSETLLLGIFTREEAAKKAKKDYKIKCGKRKLPTPFAIFSRFRENNEMISMKVKGLTDAQVKEKMIEKWLYEDPEFEEGSEYKKYHRKLAYQQYILDIEQVERKEKEGRAEGNARSTEDRDWNEERKDREAKVQKMLDNETLIILKDLPYLSRNITNLINNFGTDFNDDGDLYRSQAYYDTDLDRDVKIREFKLEEPLESDKSVYVVKHLSEGFGQVYSSIEHITKDIKWAECLTDRINEEGKDDSFPDYGRAVHFPIDTLIYL